jgi:hypothetical protein
MLLQPQFQKLKAQACSAVTSFSACSWANHVKSSVFIWLISGSVPRTLDPAWQEAFDRKANAWPREASPYPVALNPISRENFKIKVIDVQENAALLLSSECEETECLHH